MDVTKWVGNEFQKCCAKLGAPVAPLRMNPRVVRWFTPGLHVKRWLVLLMIGMVIISLGIGYALRNFYASGFRFPGITYYLTLQFIPYYVRAVLFGLLGFGLIGYALYKLTQSVLGPFLPGRDRALSEIIYNYRFLQKGPRVVALGGGTGLSTLLRGLKKYTGNLTAIVTVADDGGSSGRLRAEYRILPPGDFRQCITALADVEPLMTTLFQHRFKEGSLNGHSFGNLFIMAMAEITGDFEHAIRESGRVLAVRGQIVPSTLRDVTLIAEMADGQTRVGESSIPHANGGGAQGLAGDQGLRLQCRHPAGRDRCLPGQRSPQGDRGSPGRQHLRLRCGEQQQQLHPAALGAGGGDQARCLRSGHREPAQHPRRAGRRRQPADFNPPRSRQARPRDHEEDLALVAGSAFSWCERRCCQN